METNLFWTKRYITKVDKFLSLVNFTYQKLHVFFVCEEFCSILSTFEQALNTNSSFSVNINELFTIIFFPVRNTTKQAGNKNRTRISNIENYRSQWLHYGKTRETDSSQFQPPLCFVSNISK